LKAKAVVLNHNTGAFTMAGQLIGAPAPQASNSVSAPARKPHRVIALSRTRRNHGVFLLGAELTTVYSSRRATGSLGVSMSVGNGPQMLSGGMTPTQARAMANALMAAAYAAEVVGGAV